MTRYEMEIRVPGMDIPMRVPISPEWVERIRNDYAHELAGKIRDHAINVGCDVACAADLIDPEVK
jgi:hypothetical protein